MSGNGVARRAFQQAGLHWRTEPLVMEEPVPQAPEDDLPVVRDPAATVDIAPTTMRLHIDLLHSMGLVGLGIVLGYGAAMIVVWLNGRG